MTPPSNPPPRSLDGALTASSGASSGAPFASVLDGARRGDEASFTQLWRWFHPSLLRYLRVATRDAAEDIASETWLQVVRGLAGFEGDEGAFKGWLFTIARNRVTDWHRYTGRRPSQPFDPALDDAAGDDDTEDAVLERLGTDEALRLIAALPAEYAEIIMLRVVAGLDVAVVAEMVGKSPGSVRVTSHRALHRLRELLAASAPRLEAAPRRGGVTR